jgi:hypothetical protein
MDRREIVRPGAAHRKSLKTWRPESPATTEKSPAQPESAVKSCEDQNLQERWQQRGPLAPAQAERSLEDRCLGSGNLSPVLSPLDRENAWKWRRKWLHVTSFVGTSRRLQHFVGGIASRFGEPCSTSRELPCEHSLDLDRFRSPSTQPRMAPSRAPRIAGTIEEHDQRRTSHATMTHQRRNIAPPAVAASRVFIIGSPVTTLCRQCPGCRRSPSKPGLLGHSPDL